MTRALSRPAGEEGEEGEEGFTLIELMVVAVIMSLISIFVATAVISGLRASTRAERRTDDVANGQRVLLQLSADLRATESVVAGGGNKVVMLTRSRLGAAGTPQDAAQRVTYELVTSGTSKGQLRSTVQTGGPDASGIWQPSGLPVTRTVLGGVTVPAAAGRPLFTYLSAQDSQGQCTTGVTQSSLATTGTLTTAELPRVVAVEVWLSINSSPTISPRPVTLSGGATLVSAGSLLLNDATASTGRAGIGQGCA